MAHEHPVTLDELIHTRRSYRRYEQREVPEEAVIQILEAGRWAPSPLNLQPCRFVLVQDPAVKQQLTDLAAESKLLSGHWVRAFRPGEKHGRPADFMRAPLVIAVCADPQKNMLLVHGEDLWMLAAGMTIENMWLTAHSLGLGMACVTHWIEERAKQVLNVPLAWKLIAVLSIGYPAGGDRLPSRLPLEELVSLNQYGTKWRLEGEGKKRE